MEPPRLNSIRPAMKSAVRMSIALATSPPTSTREPAPKTMPFGLTSTTCPFDDSCPNSADGSAPITRFSDTDCAFGICTCTLACAPMSKLSQLMAARVEVCSMSMRAPLCRTDACPATTLAPVGRAVAAGGPLAPAAEASPEPSSPATSTAPTTLLRLPRPRAHSATATKVPRLSFQTRR